ncbi:cadmium resistance transporter [Lacticaseibacillus paracasei]|uniref:cadmium resistance transporter n=1 Tax=Lacticaseibacillus paracasei TaxID=1597 RepID=UPI001E56E169|nr:cadmium resistance transporter [Lacticaseibacillus paracasei]WPQ30013.1 cadmium resistance transporter [Lacticaseibacillus paracasei]
MLNDIVTGVTAYIATSLDYVVILMIIFGTVAREDRRLVYFGDLFGTGILVAASLLMAFVLKLVPEEWILGLLGLIPIGMGLKLLLFGEDDDDSVITERMGRQTNVVLNVAIITIATCGTDNIGIYVPMFAQMFITSTGTVLIVFLLMLSPLLARRQTWRTASHCCNSGALGSVYHKLCVDWSWELNSF